MFHGLTHRRDFYAGLFLMLIGLVVAVQAASYAVGDLFHMGPGFMPLALGIVLGGLGALIAATANLPKDFGLDGSVVGRPDWIGCLCIIAGPVLFIVLGTYGGLVPAIFGCVFVSALGDRTTGWRGAALLAGGTTVFGVVLFGYLLGVPFPVLRWGLS